MSNTLNLGTDGNWARKEGSLLAYNSENNNYKPLPFTFDRASSATRVNKDGLIETVGSGEPRIDYLNDSKGALLLEPTRTNLVTQSNNTTTNVWSHFNFDGGIIVDTYGYPSPNGKNEASRLVYTNSSLGSGGALLTSNITLLATGVYTISLWAKSVSGTKEIRFSPKSTASAGLSGSRVTLTNQWKRYTHTFTNDGGADRGFQFRLLETEDSGDRTFDVWGMTIEEGSYETSTIPTSGSAVTRLADSCNNGGNEQVINSTEGVLYAEINIPENIADNINISINDGTNDEYVKFLYLASTNTFRAQIQGSGNQVGVNTTSLVLGSYSKLAVSYKSGEFKLYINGSQIGNTLTGHTMPTGLDTLSFDRGDGAAPFQGNVKDVKVYNTTLNDSELQELTQV